LKKRLERLFEGRVGLAPKSHGVLDEWYKELEKRFEYRIPPGYRDAKKSDIFLHGGLIYKQRYGDCLVWFQILQHTNHTKSSSVVFVTDDTKDDWWLRINGMTVGPRPELLV
jgi:hypothetical protein